MFTRSTRIPQTLRSAISTSLGHFKVASAPSDPGDGVPGDERDDGPPLGVDHRVEDGRERQRGPRRRDPGAVEPPAPGLLMVGHHHAVTRRVRRGELVGRPGLGVQPHVPLRTRHCAEGLQVERRARGSTSFTGTSVVQVSAQPTKEPTATPAPPIPERAPTYPTRAPASTSTRRPASSTTSHRRLDEAVHASSAKAVEKQHAKGRRTARERIEMLFDEGSFVELDELARHRSTAFGQEKRRPYGDGVVTGYGTVDGRQVCVFSQDFTIFGGSLGEVYGEKITKVMDLAMKTGCPIIGINEGAGARIQEGVVSLGLYGEIFRRNVHASGVIPQISLIMGSCAGGHVYSPAVTDFTVMVDGTSNMFITGPDVIKTVTGEDVTMEELGGARTHNTKSGNAHYMGTDEEDAIEYVKALLSYLPANNLDPAPSYDESGGPRVHRPRPLARRGDPRRRQPALRHARGDHRRPGHR